MNEIIVAFITGLTTGGLSCLAVQGGLLASSLEQQLESEILNKPIIKLGRNKTRTKYENKKLAFPILLFLGAKLVAYTLLGALLGVIGSVFQLSPVMRSLLLIGVGVFMLGNALRILNVHPIFRYFSIEPPKFITRYIRQRAKDGTELFSPLFLGVLTVLIPCGVTQAMMAVAIIILILGLVTIDGGLNLIGSPLSISYLLNNAVSNTKFEQSVPAADQLTLSVENNGYFPRRLNALAGETIYLNLVTDKTYSCSRDFVIPSLGIQILLPDTGTVPIEIPAQEPGTMMRFTCSMGMYTGEIYFKE